MITSFQAKKVLAWIFERGLLNATLHRVQVRLLSPFIRAVYYHDVPPAEAAAFERQLSYFAEHFAPAGYEDLIRFHNNLWPHDRPGLILSFDDGYRSCAKVIAPLLEKYGFTGWFFVPVELLRVAPQAQRRAAVQHRTVPKSFHDGGSRVFLTWDEVRQLDQKHVVGCHTASHCRLSSDLSEPALYHELVDSKQILEQELNHEVVAFSWVGGEEWSYSRRAAELLRQADYKVAFLTNSAPIRPGTDLHFLNRTHMDSAFSPGLMRFQLSGFMDIRYVSRRKRIAPVVTANGTFAAGKAMPGDAPSIYRHPRYG